MPVPVTTSGELHIAFVIICFFTDMWNWPTTAIIKTTEACGQTNAFLFMYRPKDSLKISHSQVWVWFCLSGLWTVACWWGRSWTWRKQRRCQLVQGWKLDGLGCQAEAWCLSIQQKPSVSEFFRTSCLGRKWSLSLKGLQKWLQELMMTIHHTVYPVSDAPVRNDLQMLSCFLWPSNSKDIPLLFLPGNQTDSN